MTLKTTGGNRRKQELYIFLTCFGGAYILNVIGIIQNHSPARDLFAQLHVVFLVAVVLYGAVAILRVLYFLVARLWNRR